MSIFLPKKSKKPKSDDNAKIITKKSSSNDNTNKNSTKSNKNNNNKSKCANPIFEEWITEWRDDAIARDLQSKHTYNKV